MNNPFDRLVLPDAAAVNPSGNPFDRLALSTDAAAQLAEYANVFSVKPIPTPVETPTPPQPPVALRPPLREWVGNKWGEMTTSLGKFVHDLGPALEKFARDHNIGRDARPVRVEPRTAEATTTREPFLAAFRRRAGEVGHQVVNKIPIDAREKAKHVAASAGRVAKKYEPLIDVAAGATLRALLVHALKLDPASVDIVMRGGAVVGAGLTGALRLAESIPRLESRHGNTLRAVRRITQATTLTALGGMMEAAGEQVFNTATNAFLHPTPTASPTPETPTAHPTAPTPEATAAPSHPTEMPTATPSHPVETATATPSPPMTPTPTETPTTISPPPSEALPQQPPITPPVTEPEIIPQHIPHFPVETSQPPIPLTTAPTGAEVSGSVLDGTLASNGQPWDLLGNGIKNISTHLFRATHGSGTIDTGIMSRKLQEATNLWTNGKLNDASDLGRLFHLSNGTGSMFDELLNNDTLQSLKNLGIIR